MRLLNNRMSRYKVFLPLGHRVVAPWFKVPVFTSSLVNPASPEETAQNVLELPKKSNMQRSTHHLGNSSPSPLLCSTLLEAVRITRDVHTQTHPHTHANMQSEREIPRHGLYHARHPVHSSVRRLGKDEISRGFFPSALAGARCKLPPLGVLKQTP